MKIFHHRLISQSLLFYLAFCLSSYCFADDSNPSLLENDDPAAWHFYLAPYAWLSGVNGFYKIKADRANLNVPFDQIQHNLDFGIAGVMEAKRLLWTLILDPAYVKFTQKVYVNNVSAKANQATTIIDAGAYYQLLVQMAPEAAYTCSSLEILGGGRIMDFHSNIKYFDGRPTPLDSTSFIVPIIGARIKHNFNKKFHSWLSADIGGFKINHVNNTWSAMLGLSYSMTDHFDLNLAYKALGINYYQQVMTINTLLHGPMLGFAYSW